MAQIAYLIAGGGIFFWGLISKRNAWVSVAMGLYANVLFGLVFPYLSRASILGVPIFYLPFLGGIGAMLIRFPLTRIPRSLKILFFLCLYLSVYIFISASLRPETFVNTIGYIGMYILNFSVLFITINVVRHVSEDAVNNVLRHMVIATSIGCVIGLARYVLGVSLDGNIFPAINRNGAAFWLVFSFNILFYCQKKRLIRGGKFAGQYVAFMIGILSGFSRAGFLGMALAHIYNFRQLSRKLMVGMCLFLFIALTGVSFTPIGKMLLNKAHKTVISIQFILDNGLLMEVGHIADSLRMANLAYGIEIAKDNPWFGVGPGAFNYHAHLKKIHARPRVGKAHNFYISYFNELGLFGFVPYLLVFYSIFCMIRKIPDPLTREFGYACYITTAFNFMFSEYINIPLIWIVLGLFVGVSLKKNPKQIPVKAIPKNQLIE